MTNPLYVCCRSVPIKRNSSAGYCTAHGRRTGDHNFDHCDPARSALVLAGGKKLASNGNAISPFDVGASLSEATLQLDATRPANASLATELLFTFTREFFAVDRPPLHSPEDLQALRTRYRDLCARADWHHRWLDEERDESEGLPRGLVDRWSAVRAKADKESSEIMDEIDPGRVHVLMMTILLAIADRPGWRIACWRLDLDETTPHFSVFVVPYYEKKLKQGPKTCVSVRKHFGTRDKLSALQDWIGCVCAPLGLCRGRPVGVTHARHVAPVVYRRHQREKLKVDLAALESEREAFEAEMTRRSDDLERRRKNLDDREKAVSAREATVTASLEELARKTEATRIDTATKLARLQKLHQQYENWSPLLHTGLALSRALLDHDPSDEARALRDIIAELEPIPLLDPDMAELIGRWDQPTTGVRRP